VTRSRARLTTTAQEVKTPAPLPGPTVGAVSPASSAQPSSSPFGAGRPFPRRCWATPVRGRAAAPGTFPYCCRRLGTDSPMEPDTLSRRVLRSEESVPSRISCAPEFYFARRKANLRKSLPLHDLRHHAVSRLIEQGANIMLVSRIAGHAKPWVTLGVYAHLFRRRNRGRRARFDSLAPRHET
jgi:integrase-like protein